MESLSSENSIDNIIRRLGADYASLRRKKGFTQREVSERSGVSIFTISTFESGRSTGLVIATYTKLLKAIGCDKIMESLFIHE